MTLDELSTSSHRSKHEEVKKQVSNLLCYRAYRLRRKELMLVTVTPMPIFLPNGKSYAL